jgi:limonene-1,2-epoxide hydrolase
VDASRAVVASLEQAVARHDAAAMAALMHPDYRSEQPLHPERGFGGAEQVRENWDEIFASVPDLRLEVLRSACEGAEIWSEWRFTGNRAGDGSAFDYRGIAIFGVRDERIAWGRLYFDVVDAGGEGIAAATRRIARGG